MRTVSTLVLIGSFIGFIWAGHVPLMFMIFGIQVSSSAAKAHSQTCGRCLNKATCFASMRGCGHTLQAGSAQHSSSVGTCVAASQPPQHWSWRLSCAICYASKSCHENNSRAQAVLREAAAHLKTLCSWLPKPCEGDSAWDQGCVAACLDTVDCCGGHSVSSCAYCPAPIYVTCCASPCCSG